MSKRNTESILKIWEVLNIMLNKLYQDDKIEYLEYIKLYNKLLEVNNILKGKK